MIIFIIIASLIMLSTIIVLMKIVFEHSEEIYELRARVLELELKQMKKSQATVHRIK